MPNRRRNRSVLEMAMEDGGLLDVGGGHGGVRGAASMDTPQSMMAPSSMFVSTAASMTYTALEDYMGGVDFAEQQKPAKKPRTRPRALTENKDRALKL